MQTRRLLVRTALSSDSREYQRQVEPLNWTMVSVIPRYQASGGLPPPVSAFMLDADPTA